MEKPKIQEVIVVEGRYDKNTLLQVVDASVLELGGFGIFNDREKTALLRRLATARTGFDRRRRRVWAPEGRTAWRTKMPSASFFPSRSFRKPP